MSDEYILCGAHGGSGWYVTSDKLIASIGSKYLSSSLTGEKGISQFNVTEDKRITLVGDTIINLSVTSDKIISLLGEIGVSLEGEKNIDTLIGERQIPISLLGSAPFMRFPIRIDTTYLTIDCINVTIDRN